MAVLTSPTPGLSRDLGTFHGVLHGASNGHLGHSWSNENPFQAGRSQMIENRAIWEAAERFDLYALTEEELERLLAKHADAVITAAARYILDLRRALAAGDAP